jgi:hypothetical protein
VLVAIKIVAAQIVVPGCAMKEAKGKPPPTYHPPMLPVSAGVLPCPVMVADGACA